MKRFFLIISFLNAVGFADAQLTKPNQGDIRIQPFLSFMNISNLQKIQSEMILGIGNFGLLYRYFNKQNIATRAGVSVGFKGSNEMKLVSTGNFKEFHKVEIDGIAIEVGRERHFAGGKNSSIYWGPFFRIGE